MPAPQTCLPPVLPCAPDQLTGSSRLERRDKAVRCHKGWIAHIGDMLGDPAWLDSLAAGLSVVVVRPPASPVRQCHMPRRAGARLAACRIGLRRYRLKLTLSLLCREHAVDPSAVVSQCDEGPFSGDVVDAAQVEAGEAHGGLDNAEHWLDGLFSSSVERPGVVLLQPGFHGQAPRLGDPAGHLGRGRRLEVIGPQGLCSSDRHQRLDPACLQVGDGLAAGVSGVGQDRAGQADGCLHR